MKRRNGETEKRGDGEAVKRGGIGNSRLTPLLPLRIQINARGDLLWHTNPSFPSSCLS